MVHATHCLLAISLSRFPSVHVLPDYQASKLCWDALSKTEWLALCMKDNAPSMTVLASMRINRHCHPCLVAMLQGRHKLCFSGRPCKQSWRQDVKTTITHSWRRVASADVSDRASSSRQQRRRAELCPGTMMLRCLDQLM